MNKLKLWITGIGTFLLGVMYLLLKKSNEKRKELEEVVKEQDAWAEAVQDEIEIREVNTSSTSKVDKLIEEVYIEDVKRNKVVKDTPITFTKVKV